MKIWKIVKLKLLGSRSRRVLNPMRNLEHQPCKQQLSALGQPYRYNRERKFAPRTYSDHPKNQSNIRAPGFVITGWPTWGTFWKCFWDLSKGFCWFPFKNVAQLLKTFWKHRYKRLLKTFWRHRYKRLLKTFWKHRYKRLLKTFWKHRYKRLLKTF